jgi:hypothetical protein
VDYKITEVTSLEGNMGEKRVGDSYESNKEKEERV